MRWIASSGVVAFLGFGGWFAYMQWENHLAEPVPVETVTVKRETVEAIVNERGTVKWQEQQTLTSRHESAVDRVLVSAGDRVKTGQVLIVLRDRDQPPSLAEKRLEIQNQELVLARAREKVVTAREKLAAARRELETDEIIIRQQRELTLGRGRQEIIEAREKLAAEEKELRKREALEERGFIATSELQQQEEAVRRARTALQEAEATVSADLLEPENLRQQQQTIAREGREQTIRAQAELQEAELAVRTATRHLQRLQIDLAEIQQRLENNIITAPIDGKILNVLVKAGDRVTPDEELLTLGNPEEELVVLNLSALDAARVKVNQEAQISAIDSNPAVFEGRVQEISPRHQQDTVPATIRLDRPSGTLIPGSQVNVNVILEQRQDVVALKKEAVQREKLDSFVWIQDERETAQKQTIQTGLEGLTNVEVTSGLTIGDEVLLPPPGTFLEPGTPVIIQKDSAGRSREDEEDAETSA
jgi:HlyD family secretion protein